MRAAYPRTSSCSWPDSCLHQEFPRIADLVWLRFFFGMWPVKSRYRPVQLKSHAGTSAFDHLCAQRYEQSLDPPPLQICWNRNSIDCLQRLPMRGVHGIMISDCDSKCNPISILCSSLSISCLASTRKCPQPVTLTKFAAPPASRSAIMRSEEKYLRPNVRLASSMPGSESTSFLSIPTEKTIMLTSKYTPFHHPRQTLTTPACPRRCPPKAAF